MSAIKHYDVRITSNEGEIVSRRIDNETTFSFEYLENHTNTEFTVNITVFDIMGQSSNSAVIVKTFGMQNVIGSTKGIYIISYFAQLSYIE